MYRVQRSGPSSGSAPHDATPKSGPPDGLANPTTACRYRN